MKEKDKKMENKEAATTTTTSSPLLQKSEIDKIENMKKTLKEKKDTNPPKKSDVISQTNVNTPNKSNVTGQKKSKDELLQTEIKEKPQRSNTWTLLLYQDSAPENWEDKLKELHIPFIVSPLHDKDLKPDGTTKKPHYHIIVRFRSKKSFKQIKEGVCDPLGGPHPQPVFDFPMMVRYLAHLDDPEKAQYDIEDIEVYGNIDVKQYLYNHQEYQMEILKDILNFCEVYDITEYSTICNYARDERPGWFPYVTKIFRSTVDAYVRSQRYASENDGN